MPNSLAYLTLMAWPLVVALMFHRWSAERALIWSILGAYLLLPPASHAFIDPPAIPPLDKMSIPALAAYLCATQLRRLSVPLWPQNWGARLLMLGFVLTPFGTILTNPEPVSVARDIPLPGLVLYDAVSVIANQAFVILTFALARALLISAAAIRELLIALMLGGLAYSLPMLVEVRLSPQINIWVYGFFQHSFEQMMRQGGFRPIVFLAHGLWVAFFAMTAVLAATALAREAEGPKRRRLLLAAGYLLGVLVLCKSAGSLIYALALAPMLLLLPQHWLLRVSLLMALLTISYPVLRANGIIPADDMVSFAARYSAERAQSLEYRFDNEALLVEHAYRKPWFGWGGFERNLLHDPITGESTTVTDGRWVITLGMFGWAGYVAEFGLLCLPILLLWYEGRVRRLPLSGPVVALAVIHGINLVDLLPNATLTPLTWLTAGALLGHAEALAATRLGHRTRHSPRHTPNQRTIL